VKSGRLPTSSAEFRSARIIHALIAQFLIKQSETFEIFTVALLYSQYYSDVQSYRLVTVAWEHAFGRIPAQKLIYLSSSLGVKWGLFRKMKCVEVFGVNVQYSDRLLVVVGEKFIEKKH
jgi:hypothetical protein